MRINNFAILIFIFAFLLVTAGVSRARDNKPIESAEIGSWMYDLSGTINLYNPGFDFSSNLKNDGVFEKKTNASINYQRKIGYCSDIMARIGVMRNSGRLNAYGKTNTMLNSVVFGAGGFAVVNTELSVDTLDLLGVREIMSWENGNADLLYGIRLGRMMLDFTDTTFNASNSYERKLALPIIGLKGRADITKNLCFYGVYLGTNSDTGNGSSKKNYIINEMEAGVEYKLTEPEPDYTTIGPGLPAEPRYTSADRFEWVIQAGYREQYMRETESQNVMVFRHGGPQFKFIVRH